MQNQSYLVDSKRFAVHDGPGVRTTFFLKGCPLHCVWCHNPESISPKPQMAFYEHKCLHCGECVSVCKQDAQKMDGNRHVFDFARCAACGACEEVCLGLAMKFYGRKMTVDDCMKIALEDVEFYRNSGGGVTVSGGEPFFQSEFTLSFLDKLKTNGIHTALDTSGYASRENVRKSLSVTDMYLFDFKHCSSMAHERLTGKRNEIIKENLIFLSENNARIEIRIPFVPGCNDSDENMNETGEFLGSLRIEAVRLLPYHSLARTKYHSLGMSDTMPRTDAPSPDQLNHAADILRSHGVNVLPVP